MPHDKPSALQVASWVALAAACVVAGYQVGAGIRALLRVSIAQKTLLRELLAEVRGYSAAAVEAIERSLAAVAEEAES